MPHFTHHEDGHAVVFDGVPIPPSSNNQYMIVKIHGRPRHVPTKELTQFRKAMTAYFAEHAEMLKFAREFFSGHPLAVSAIFGFEKSRLLTKKGHFKRLDVSNRLKALHDAFAEALLIDDSAFVDISARKYCVQTELDEQVRVEIRLTDFEEKLAAPAPHPR